MRTSGLPGAFAFLLAIAALASATAARASLTIVGPHEVEQRFVLRYGPNAYLLVDDRQWELVTDPHSPLVSSLGDGSFHAMDTALVDEAVRDLGSIGERITGRILVLPYPRRTTLPSSCEDGTIFLSPGVREVAAEHVHATVAHEVGHLVQERFFPEGSSAWSQYVERRGLDSPRFDPYGAHRDRPREIFAEDFRALFGGSLATTSGTIENPELVYPANVPGLAEWLRREIGASAPAAFEEALREPAIFPNPCPATARTIRVRFHAKPVPGPAHADVFDVTGRLVQTLDESTTVAASVEFRWNGRDTAGRRVAPGVYFVRWRERPAAGVARVGMLN